MLEAGDILLIRTGWTGRLMAAGQARQAAMMDFTQQRSPGLKPGTEMAGHLWDSHVAAVLRGNSARPLYVTAAGMPRIEAADLVRRMAGRYRLPDALRHADALARCGPRHAGADKAERSGATRPAGY